MKNSNLAFLASCLVLPVVILGCNKDKDDSNNSTITNNATTTTTTMTRTNAPITTMVTSDTSTNSTSHAADNSAQNQADRSTNSVTPMNQGNSDADLKVTQQIRQAVTSGTNNYSMDAQNIKIMTVSGKVTLRGPVDSDSEKSSIDSIAKSVVGNDNVDDQLEVSPKSSATNSPSSFSTNNSMSTNQ